ncbi:MAG: hypothetical protein ACXAE3_07425 [Candidatus Kariarchaeaceae archaeon]|jgi:nucleotide-binding universal stress UspA family protein
MQDVEGAISEAKERLSKLDKLWPSKESRTEFNPNKVLCFVDANDHSEDAIKITLQVAQEFDAEFVIRSLFDKELMKLADTDLTHLKQSIIQIVKDSLRETDFNQGVTFLEGDAIQSIENQLSNEYDIMILPVPYHSNLTDHPEAVALGSLGEYLVSHSDRPLFLVPDVDTLKDDIFSSVVIVVNDVADILQNQNYIRAISRNRSHLKFVFLYDAKDIENLAESSKGVVDAEMVKKRVHAKLEQYGKHTTDEFGEFIESVEYRIFSGDFSENIQNLLSESDASLLTMILPANRKGYRYLLFQDMLRDKKLRVPVMVLRVTPDEPKQEEKPEETPEESSEESSTEEIETPSDSDMIEGEKDKGAEVVETEASYDQAEKTDQPEESP